MGRYVIIGFGSLLWDLDGLEPFVVNPWKYYAGPVLPLEFALVSHKRKMGLALVIDFEYGTPCPTCIIKSRRESVTCVISDLASREQTPRETIGYYERYSGSGRSQSSIVMDRIKTWLDRSQWAGVVWTDSRRNFEAMTDTKFSVDSAQRYLRSLPTPSFLEAKRYVDNAPSRVNTRLRNALTQKSWWHSPEYTQNRLFDNHSN